MEKKLQVMHVLMGICFAAGIYIATYLLVFSLAGSFEVLREIPLMFLNAAAMGAAACALLLTIKKEEYEWKIKGGVWQNILAVVLLAYGTSALFNFLLGSIPWQEFAGEQAVPNENVYYGIPLLARMVCYELIAPAAEELLFRQVIFIRLKKIIPLWLAVVVSALLFGIYHGNLVQGIYAFIMGIFLALVYEWTGNFVFPVLFHMIANHLSDICYEFEFLGQAVYSFPGMIAASFMIAVAFLLFYKKQNKCSGKALRSSK